MIFCVGTSNQVHVPANEQMLQSLTFQIDHELPVESPAEISCLALSHTPLLTRESAGLTDGCCGRQPLTTADTIASAILEGRPIKMLRTERVVPPRSLKAGLEIGMISPPKTPKATRSAGPGGLGCFHLPRKVVERFSRRRHAQPVTSSDINGPLGVRGASRI